MPDSPSRVPSQSDLPPEKHIQATVKLLSAVAHPARLLVLLALRRADFLSAGQLQQLAGLSQSAMSHQLRILRDARLVQTRRDGKQILYALHDHHVAHIVEDALSHVSEQDGVGSTG